MNQSRMNDIININWDHPEWKESDNGYHRIEAYAKMVYKRYMEYEKSLQNIFGKYFFKKRDRGAIEANPLVAMKKDSVQSLHSEKK